MSLEFASSSSVLGSLIWASLQHTALSSAERAVKGEPTYLLQVHIETLVSCLQQGSHSEAVRILFVPDLGFF